jgi:ATP-dependent DNA ligase
MKATNWKHNDLKGDWIISRKIDGVRCHKTNEGYISRNGKPLFNIPDFNGEIVEIYCGSFKESITKTRTSTKDLVISNDEVYHLYPIVDDRLLIGNYSNPTKELINELLQIELNNGYEGLILRQDDKFLKVKSVYSEDILIKGYIEGKGKYEGSLGAIITDKGNVGTGLTDADRQLIWTNRESLLNTYIEVEFMENTPQNKFRHPRFVRLRPDK